MTGKPQHDKALIDLAHLPRTGNDAATVDHRAQAIHRAILFDQQLGCKFGRPVKRAIAGKEKYSEMPAALTPGCRPARRKKASSSDRAAARAARDGIDAAGREKHEIRAMPPRMFETIGGTEQIGVDEIIRIAVIAGMHTRLGRGFDEDVGRPAAARSVGARTSPCTNSTPPARSASSASSLPRRLRLSKAMTVADGRSRLNASAKLEPTKPAPPVIRMR